MIRQTLLTTVLVLLVAPSAMAQRRGQDPHLAYAFPAGCQRGTTCEILLGGQFIREADEAYVALGPDDRQDVQVEIMGWYRPMTRGEYISLRRRMQEARIRLLADWQNEGKPGEPTEKDVAQYLGITDEVFREMQIYRERESDKRRQPNEQLDEQVRIRVTVDRDAKPGKRELRLLTDSAMSNPLWIHVGQWIEVQESEPNHRFPCEVVDTLPVVVNGQIMPGDVDRISFEARAGMKLVMRVDAREVIPYLADAVPGWFQAIMRLLDHEGNEIQVADAFYFRQDPMMYFEVPEDGMYTVEIRDSIYRGREDFVYRLTLGEIPMVTSVFPLGAQVDSTAHLRLGGWNLSQSHVTMQTMSRANYLPKIQCSVTQSGGIPVEFPLRVDPWPEAFDQEPNNQTAQAQSIKPPITINGRINYEGDVDVYRIAGGGRVVAEVEARSLGSPMDSILRLVDSDGNTIAENDDHKDLTQSLLTHHADSHITATLSGVGEHYLFVGDAQNGGGNDFAYRLQVRRPAPDYELRVTPSNLVVRPGQNVAITVFAMRRDGFNDDIEVSLIDPPEGVELNGNLIPGDADSCVMTLQIPRTLKPPTRSAEETPASTLTAVETEQAAEEEPKEAVSSSARPIRLQMQGRAVASRRSRGGLVRKAIPAENMMQAFIWHHLVPVEHWNVIVSKRAAGKMPFDYQPSAVNASRTSRLQIASAGYTYVPIQPAWGTLDTSIHFLEMTDPPEGVTASLVTLKSGPVIKLVSDASKTKKGQRGNLLLSVYKEVTAKPTEENPAPKPRRVDYGYLPAIAYQIGK